VVGYFWHLLTPPLKVKNSHRSAHAHESLASWTSVQVAITSHIVRICAYSAPTHLCVPGRLQSGKQNAGWHHSHECALTNMQTMFLRSTGLGLSENMPLMSNRPLSLWVLFFGRHIWNPRQTPVGIMHFRLGLCTYRGYLWTYRQYYVHTAIDYAYGNQYTYVCTLV
jgi:hypothetical protein